jgi:hypothetical protein
MSQLFNIPLFSHTTYNFVGSTSFSKLRKLQLCKAENKICNKKNCLFNKKGLQKLHYSFKDPLMPSTRSLIPYFIHTHLHVINTSLMIHSSVLYEQKL